MQKRERTGASIFYWLNWKSKHFNWNVIEWKATQPSLRVFSGKLSKWEACKSWKIPYKPSKLCGLSTQSIQTLYFRWYLKSYHFAIFLLKILLFLLKTLKFSRSFIWMSWFFKQTENNHTLSQSSHVSAMGYGGFWDLSVRLWRLYMLHINNKLWLEFYVNLDTMSLWVHSNSSVIHLYILI